MPHLKCETCRTRLYSPVGSGDLHELCPGCGAPLEAVHTLDEIVGFRSVKPRSGATESDVAISGHLRIAAAVAELMSRRGPAEGPHPR